MCACPPRRPAALQVADGSWAECSSQFRTLFPNPPPDATLRARHTVTGQQCSLPFFFGGEGQSPCIACCTAL